MQVSIDIKKKCEIEFLEQKRYPSKDDRKIW